MKGKPMQKASISAAKRLFIISAIVILMPCTQAYAGPPKSSEFLQHADGQRAWWFTGAFETLAHSMSQIDKVRSDCIADWYFKAPEQRRKELEDTMRKYPDHAPSSVVIALVQKVCGKLGQ